MIDRQLITKLDFKNPATWLATWFGCGLMKPGPGTWGTLGALPMGVFLLAIGGPSLLLINILGFFYIGLKVTEKFEAMTGTHDHGAVVIDEAVGVWIALLPAVLDPVHGLAAFALFRFFDILKPWPVGWADKKLPGAWGVMLDDVLAGLYAAAILGGFRYAGVI
ncbi:MAG: phosphatidylglycerophosphatase A [Alphaproteobacteria bacterium]|nr:phosphatidylglycerophosphatase A [Alphaproteobacteria bacterium]